MKNLKKVLVAAVFAAAMFTGCSDALVADGAASENAASRAAVTETSASTVRLTSDLNPGFGNAVYFAGSFEEGKNWTVAVRGSYDNGWYADVTAAADFEWKALTGAYSLGNSVSDFSALTWEAGENNFVEYRDPRVPANLYVLVTGGMNRYGASTYFTGAFDQAENWQKAVRGTYIANAYKFYAVVNASSKKFEWKALHGFGSSDEVLYAPFNGFNWEAGENKTTVYNMKEFMETLSVSSVSTYYNADENKLTSTFCFYDDEIVKYMSFVKVELFRGKEVISTSYVPVSEGRITFADSIRKNDLMPYSVTVTPVNVWGTEGVSVKDKEFVPGMNYVQSRDFTMGSDSDIYEDNAAHKVEFSSTYYLSKYEVTQGQFVELFGYNPVDVAYKVYARGENYPAFYVSWVYAIAFCNKMSIKAGFEPVYSVEGVDFATVTFDQLRRISDFASWKNVSVNSEANGYRLPTEAEWEYAATANGYHTEQANNIMEFTSSPSVVEIGCTAPNAWGFYDMTGNVTEYVWDSYAPFTSESVTDPEGPAQSETKVVRGGGAWLNHNWDLLYRGSWAFNSGAADVGFRVALSVR